MDPALQSRIRSILSLASQQDWGDESFSLKKAHICAELSAIVYEDVQEYELKKASRIHLFASDAYRRIIKSGKPNRILDSLSERDFEARFFVIRGRYAVILGTVFKDVLILAIRGTVFRKLWDWKANVDTRKFQVRDRYGLSVDDMFFHRGFFESIVPHFKSIADEAGRRSSISNDNKVIWTGHSLGGAMAAVGAAMSEAADHRSDFPQLRSHSFIGETVGAYTFGMPRYCGLGGVCFYRGPYHVYRKSDLVPTVPLRKMGFADCSREYEIMDDGIVTPSERTDVFGVFGHVPKLLSSIRAHSIEGYADSLAKAANVPRP